MPKPSVVLDEICALLDTYRGRDKVLRTLCYTTKLISGLTSDELVAKRFQTFSSKMSGARAVLRLLDDLPMLQYNLQYGLGKSEPDRLLSALGVVTNIIDQAYYPIEKISWFAENHLISVQDPTPWDTASSVFWVLSIYLSLMKSLRYTSVLEKTKKQTGFDARIIALQKMELLTSLRLSLDLVHAVSTLPRGFLWAGRLNTWQVGLVATISSVLGLYQIFAKRSIPP